MCYKFDPVSFIFSHVDSEVRLIVVIADQKCKSFKSTRNNPSQFLFTMSSIYRFYSRKHLIPLIFLQEDYDRLNEALSGTDHSWTALTLKVKFVCIEGQYTLFYFILEKKVFFFILTMLLTFPTSYALLWKLQTNWSSQPTQMSGCCQRRLESWRK